MPLAGFLHEDARSQLDVAKQVTFEQFEADPSLYAPRLAPASEALLWSLLQMAEDRQRVPEGKITASEIADPLRMILLRETNDYFHKPSTRVHAMMGTLKHAHMLRHRAGVWTSLRLEDELGSGELDTFIVRTGELIDLKNVGCYKAKRILVNGPQRDAWDYWMQVNRYAGLLEDPKATLVQYDAEGVATRQPWAEVLKGKSVEVRKLTLEILPRDLTRRNRPEMERLTAVPDIISAPLPRVPAAEVKKVYAAKLKAKDKVLADNHAPVCRPDEVWMDAKKFPLRCAEWCPVRDLCVAYQHDIGEPHYLDSFNGGDE